jgi:hypothetical protein
MFRHYWFVLSSSWSHYAVKMNMLLNDIDALQIYACEI